MGVHNEEKRSEKALTKIHGGGCAKIGKIGETRPKGVLEDTLGRRYTKNGEKRPKNVLKDTLGKGCGQIGGE